MDDSTHQAGEWVTDPGFILTLVTLKAYRVGDELRLSNCQEVAPGARGVEFSIAEIGIDDYIRGLVTKPNVKGYPWDEVGNNLGLSNPKAEYIAAWRRPKKEVK